MIQIWPDVYALTLTGFVWGWLLRPVIWDYFLKPILRETFTAMRDNK